MCVVSKVLEEKTSNELSAAVMVGRRTSDDEASLGPFGDNDDDDDDDDDNGSFDPNGYSEDESTAGSPRSCLSRTVPDPQALTKLVTRKSRRKSVSFASFCPPIVVSSNDNGKDGQHLAPPQENADDVDGDDEEEEVPPAPPVIPAQVAAPVGRVRARAKSSFEPLRATASEPAPTTSKGKRPALELSRSGSRLSTDGGDASPSLSIPSPCSMSSPFTRRSGSFCHSNAKRISETHERTKGEDSGGLKTVNQYSVVSKLGTGAYSKVNLVMDNKTKEVRAMKVMKKGLLRKRGALDNVRREMALLKKMDHPNVVNLMEVIDDNRHDKLCLVFEYLEKGEIIDLRDNGTTDGVVMPVSEARKAMIDVIDGLSFLHQNLIFHRDIKPANLLLDKDGTVKVADLGVAICFDSVEEARNMNSFEGTPAFMPPEVHRGDESADAHAVDLWALGVTLYVLLFGKLPFFGRNIFEIKKEVLNKPLTVPDSACAYTEHLLERLLEKDPAKRITMDELKVHPFFLFSAECKHFMTGMKPVELSEDDILQSITTRQWRRLSVMFTKVRSQLKLINDAVKKVEKAADDASDVGSLSPYSARGVERDVLSASSACTDCVETPFHLGSASPPPRPLSARSASGQSAAAAADGGESPASGSPTSPVTPGRAKWKKLSTMFTTVRSTLQYINEQVREERGSESNRKHTAVRQSPGPPQCQPLLTTVPSELSVGTDLGEACTPLSQFGDPASPVDFLDQTNPRFLETVGSSFCDDEEEEESLPDVDFFSPPPACAPGSPVPATPTPPASAASVAAAATLFDCDDDGAADEDESEDDGEDVFRRTLKAFTDQAGSLRQVPSDRSGTDGGVVIGVGSSKELLGSAVGTAPLSDTRGGASSTATALRASASSPSSLSPCLPASTAMRAAANAAAAVAAATSPTSDYAAYFAECQRQSQKLVASAAPHGAYASHASSPSHAAQQQQQRQQPAQPPVAEVLRRAVATAAERSLRRGYSPLFASQELLAVVAPHLQQQQQHHHHSNSRQRSTSED
eukprot:Rhum_TRINITY_DN14934_c23_g1::Rhum_TRINITY_DN14934_c23_g1_i1::g.129492::m.129492/K07359/CAMKK2; calcium/calmodulin-dependent protein kinase kinase 2